ncbi:MAG TPA: hypothetical protein VIT23_04620 [Terrimicrobiaceae bacterium]
MKIPSADVRRAKGLHRSADESSGIEGHSPSQFRALATAAQTAIEAACVAADKNDNIVSQTRM